MRIINRIVGLLFLALVIITGSSPVQALQRSMALDAIGFDKDLIVKAPQSSVAVSFPVPRLAKVNSAIATFSLTPNSQINDDASFSFYLNDKLLETRTVKEIKQKKYQTINLPLDSEPKDTLRLQIKSSMFMTNDICKDISSGALFYTIHKDTKIDYEYDMLPVRSVSDFIGSFQQSLVVVVPNSADMHEMMPAIWIYGIIKKNYPHLDIQVIKAGDLVNRPITPRIWVGLRNQLPPYFSKSPAGVALADSNTLLLSAGTMAELETVVKNFADTQGFPNNSTGSRKISVNGIETPVGITTDAISLGSQTNQEGVLQASANFSVYPALLRSVPDRMGIHLEGSHMVASSQNKPVQLDVYFNSNLVHSSVLDQSGRFNRDIAMPANVEVLSQNNLNIQLNATEEPGRCLVQGKTQSGQILPGSYLWGAGQQKMNHFTWANIGLYFGRHGTVLIDDKLGDKSLKLLTNTMMLLNRQLPPGLYAFPKVQPLSAQSFVPTDQYVVVLAMAGNIPPYLQDLMPGMQGQSPVSTPGNSQIALGSQTNSKAVVGKIAENKGFPVVVLSANTDGVLLAEALQYLNRAAHFRDLIGNTLTYRQPGFIDSMDVRDDDNRSTDRQNVVKGMLARFWDQNKTIIIIAAVAFVLLLLLIFIISYIRNRSRSKKGTPPMAPVEQNYNYRRKRLPVAVQTRVAANNRGQKPLERTIPGRKQQPVSAERRAPGSAGDNTKSVRAVKGSLKEKAENIEQNNYGGKKVPSSGKRHALAPLALKSVNPRTARVPIKAEAEQMELREQRRKSLALAAERRATAATAVMPESVLKVIRSSMEENEAVKAVEQKQRRKRVPVSAERRVVASTATMVKPTRTEKGSIVENVESIERKRRGRKKLTVGSERNAAEQTPAKAESSRMLRAARMEEPVPGARGRKKQNAISNPRKISNTKVKIRGHKNGTGVLNHNAILSEKNIAREITQKPMKTSHAKQPSIKRRAIVKKHHRASNEINESAETKTTREEDRTRRHEPTKTLVN